MKPNVFEISPGEFTSDTFFFWLLQWANPSSRIYNSALHICATDFVKLLLKKQNIELTEIDSIQVGRQHSGEAANKQKEFIDIWALINEQYFIVLQDKIYTSERLNQLENYKPYKPYDWSKVICVYLRTETAPKKTLEGIIEKGFSLVERLELVEFFRKYDISNDIYNDFVEKINKREENERAFEIKRIEYWNWACMKGFCHFLDTQLDIIDWKFVITSNGGGLFYLKWHYLEWKGCGVYLQIEHENLHFKITTEDKDNRSQMIEEWSKILFEKASEKGKSEIVKPPRLGKGSCVTVGIVRRKNWLGANNEIINKDRVIEKLKEYETLLDSCV